MRLPRTKAKTPAVTPRTWLAETANGEGKFGSVNILSDLGYIQHHQQETENRGTNCYGDATLYSSTNFYLDGLQNQVAVVTDH